MDEHISRYFSEFSDLLPEGNFHRVLALHEGPDLDWKTIRKQIPDLPQGWFELTHLSSQDRVQFLLDFWMSQLPYCAGSDSSLAAFFSSLDDICLFATQEECDEPFILHLVYSLADNRGFYRGALPATEAQLQCVLNMAPGHLFPKDYLSFLRIHNGFWKTTDTTGLISTLDLRRKYLEFQQPLESKGVITTNKGKPVDPTSLIPFYESFGMPYYQCFWTDWYPEDEMGNVYYSVDANLIPDPTDKPSIEDLTFPTFLQWLLFYLEQVVV